MPILYENPGEVGASRVVACGRRLREVWGPLYRRSIFGTATTFDAITGPRANTWEAAIAPGIQISAESPLSADGQAPRIEVAKAEKAPSARRPSPASVGNLFRLYRL